MRDLLLPLLAGLLVLLQLLDIYTTHRILAAGGRELNKPLAWLMGRLGVLPALLVVKVPVMAAMLWACWHVAEPWGLIGLGVCCVSYIGVVGHNFHQLWLMTREQ